MTTTTRRVCECGCGTYLRSTNPDTMTTACRAAADARDPAPLPSLPGPRPPGREARERAILARLASGPAGRHQLALSAGVSSTTISVYLPPLLESGRIVRRSAEDVRGQAYVYCLPESS